MGREKNKIKTRLENIWPVRQSVVYTVLIISGGGQKRFKTVNVG